MRVSVVVPAYNHRRFLKRRIQSILEQTFQDFELLLLDDASTDGSQTIIESYRSDPRVSIHLNSANSGSPFVQWNKGIQLARGELVWIAESDDDAGPRLLEDLINAFDYTPGLVLAYCQSEVIDSDDAVIGHMKEWTGDLHPSRWHNSFVADGLEECRRYVFVKNTVPNASAVLFRRASYLAAGGAPEDMRLCGDWLLWARIMLRGQLAFIAAPHNRFRQHDCTQRTSVARQIGFAESLTVMLSLLSVVTPEPFVMRQAARSLRSHWWLVVHHTPAPAPWSWVLTQTARLRLSSWLRTQLLALGILARLLRTSLGRSLLSLKRGVPAT
jgi:hypothetical protein